MSLLLELMADDLEASRDFYLRVLGFEVVAQEANGYTALRRGEAVIALSRRRRMGGAANTGSEQRPGIGVEIVLEVDDVGALHRTVESTGWPLASPLKTQSWGATDFRVADPDGYRLRITSRG